MKKQIIPFIFFMLLLSLPSVLADYKCLSNQTIQFNISVNDKQITTLQNCEFGCDVVNNVCNPNPMNQVLIFIGVLAVIIVIAILLIRKVKI